MKKVFKIIGIAAGILIAVMVITSVADAFLDDEKVEKYDEDSYCSSDTENDDAGEGNVCGDDSGNDSDSNGGSCMYDGSWSLGTAKVPDGTTVVVSIFTDDSVSSWNSDSDDDLNTMADSLDYVGIACDWISESSKKYGYDAQFVYDWSENADLGYTADVDCDIVKDEDNNTDVMDGFIDSNVPTDKLLSEYNADNILYLVYINTPDSNEETSCTVSYYDGASYPYEICFMYVNCEGEEEAPAAYAHEMLYTFGAIDLYMADYSYDDYNITQDFVDYIENSDGNDIMYTTYDAYTDEPHYDEITNELTDIDAYYVGWLDDSELADQWGLVDSEHQSGSFTG